MPPSLPAFQYFTQLGHSQFQSLEVASDAVPVDQLPRQDLHQSNAVRAVEKKGGVHDLSLGLVRLEELHRAVHRESNEDNPAHMHKNGSGQVPSAVELARHRAERLFFGLVVTVFDDFPDLFVTHVVIPFRVRELPPAPPLKSAKQVQ